MEQAWGDVAHTEVLEASVHSPGFARDIVSRLCAAAHVDAVTVQNVLLLTSEVLTNAVTHGLGAPVLSVKVHATAIRVAVADDGSDQPHLVSPPGVSVAGGRGVYLVDMLSSRWGSEPRVGSPGKAVWFEIDQPTPELNPSEPTDRSA